MGHVPRIPTETKEPATKPSKCHTESRRERVIATPSEMRRPLFILSLDGGGVRGCLSAVLLERLDAAVPNFVRDSVDVIAGTSTGAIIALMLAKNTPTRDIVRDYVDLVPKVFGRPRSLAERAFSAKYDVTPLRDVLEAHFGMSTLGRLDKSVCVTALRIDGRASKNAVPSLEGGFWRPAVFTNLPAVPGVSPDIELRCVDACLRSASAPTIFPVHQGYVDGGLWANNPSTVALAKALLHYPDLRRKDVRVLSIGTGKWRNALRLEDNTDLGLVHWSPYMLDLLLDASSLHAELASMLLNAHYCRLDPSFDVPIGLDDIRALDSLLECAARSDIEHAVDFIRRVRDSDEEEEDDDSFEILGGSANRLHSHQWAELVDLAWIDVARDSTRHTPPRNT